jgi:hypothetical protein
MRQQRGRAGTLLITPAPHSRTALRSPTCVTDWYAARILSLLPVPPPSPFFTSRLFMIGIASRPWAVPHR